MKLSEFDLIDRFKKFQNLSPRVIRGIGDDAAVLALDAKRYQIFTTDMCVEDVHFTRGMPARSVGWKAMAVNVSDIAAMGGLPTFAVVSIGVPASAMDRVAPEADPFPPAAKRGREGAAGGGTRSITGEPYFRYIDEVYAGMHACAKKFGVSIVGGDTVKADQLVINVALLGEVEKKYLVTRDGAKPGDRVFVSGPLGNSLRSGHHLDFMPRIKAARFLVEHFKPSAMMDISDGLSGDLRHILKASGVGAVLDEGKIPRAKGAALAQALSDGEDFELLFTLSSAKARKLLECRKDLVEIGEIIASPRKLLFKSLDGQIKPLAAKGFIHF